MGFYGIYYLIGGFPGTWLDYFSIQLGIINHYPNWRTHIFQRVWNHQPGIMFFLHLLAARVMTRHGPRCFFLQHGSHIVYTLQGLDGSHFKSSHPFAIWIMRGSYLSRHRSRPESLSVNGEHAGSVDVCGIIWAPKFTLPKLAGRTIPTYPIYSEFYGQFSDEQGSSGYQLPSMPIFCCKQNNNQLVGLRDKLQETPIFHRKIYGFL